MRGKTTTTLLILFALLAMAASPAAAHPKDYDTHSDAYSKAYNPEFGDTVPPVFDVLVLRPAFLVGAVTTTAIWLVEAPFIALTGPENLTRSFSETPGELLRAVFVDPVGSH